MKPRRIMIALLLCGLFGPVGLHRFYVGRVITGAIQLLSLLCVIGWVVADFPYYEGDVNVLLLLGQLVALLLVGVWPSIDFYLLISGKFTDGNGRPLVE